jgi:hypothetical protein
MKHIRFIKQGQEYILKLIDYDSMFLPSFKGEDSITTGMPGFQHPMRLASDFSETIDRFSFWIFLTALEAFKINPSLWQNAKQNGFNKEEQILFTYGDLALPRQSETFQLLKQNQNNALKFYTEKLIGFCNTSSLESIENLKKDNIDKNVFYSGDLMKDLLYSNLQRVADPKIGDYIFCTIHRNYTKKNPGKLKEFFLVLNSLSKKILFPLHPATHNTLNSQGIDLTSYQNIQILPPLSYVQSISYQKFSSAVITDSGGVQKEAYWLKKPCFTIRKETEWNATLKGNWNQLLYEDLSRLPELIENIPSDKHYDETLYGNGQASTMITNKLSTLI